MIRGLLLLAIIFLIFTFPATWLLMLFLGNLGLGLSYWGDAPARHPRVLAALHQRYPAVPSRDLVD